MRPYRHSDLGDTSTPLARVNVRGWSHAITACAAIAGLLPFLMIGSFWCEQLGTHQAGRAVLVCEVAVPLMLAFMGRRLVRGQESPPLLMLLVAMVPVAVASFETWRYARAIRFDCGVYSSIDTLSILARACELAWIVAAFNFALASLSVAGLFATVDRSRTTNERGRLSRLAFAIALVALPIPGFFRANSTILVFQHANQHRFETLFVAIWQPPALTFFLVLMIPAMFAASVTFRQLAVAMRSGDASERHRAREATFVGAVATMGAFVFMVVAEVVKVDDLLPFGGVTPAWNRAQVWWALLLAVAALIAWAPSLYVALRGKNQETRRSRIRRALAFLALGVCFFASAHVAGFARGFDAPPRHR